MSKPLPDRVRAILATELCRPLDQCTDTANLADDLGCDSLDRIALQSELEAQFRIREIQDAEIEAAVTVGDVIALVQRLVGAKANA